MADYNATERHTKVLQDYLKLGSESPGDDEESTVGVNPDQQPKPEGRGTGTIDAPWGEKDAPNSSSGTDAVHNSDAVMEGFIQSRQNMLDVLFDSKKPAVEAEKKFVQQQFDHAKSGDYESKAILLEKSSSDRTLSELTKGLLD